MIEIKCSSTGNTALLTDMVAFQGESKKRSEADIDQLAQSLIEDGLLQPFSLWQAANNTLKVLDGHGRMKALVQLALRDPSILTQEFPIVLYQAETEEEAIKACLQMMSQCGRINKTGVIKFAAPVIEGCKAPIIVKATQPVKVKKNIENNNKVLLTIRVDKDKVQQLISILKDVDGVDVYV